MTVQQAAYRLTGSRELDAAFSELPDSLRRKHIRVAVKKCAHELKREMKKRVPRSKHTNTTLLHSAKTKRKYANRQVDLFRSIKIVTSQQWKSAEAQRAAGRIAAAVGPEWPFGAHAHLLEFGHRLVAWGKRTGRRVGARPFMRPALDAVRPKTKRIQAEWIKKGLEREVQRLRIKHFGYGHNAFAGRSRRT